MHGKTQLRVIRYDLHEPLVSPSQPAPVVHSRLRLGDWFAVIAKPVARFLDKWFKTHYVGCGPCGARQQAMNRWPAKFILWLKSLTI